MNELYSSPFIHVVAGVIPNSQGDILLTRRLDYAHQGGLWEFPGGKRELGETAEQALARELQEELGILLQQTHPLIRIYHTYPASPPILLDVWQVEQWQGQPWGREQQTLEWTPVTQLTNKKFPAANYPILTALQLPPLYLLTPEPNSLNDKQFFYQLETCLPAIPLLQFRAKHLPDKEYCYIAEKILKICDRYATQLLVNATPETALSVGAHGVHLTRDRLKSYSQRPLPADLYVAASCHNLAEIQQANLINADLIVLSPVRATLSHPEASTLGWHQFFQLTESSNCPVFALGGMKIEDLPKSWAHGGQGIAAIRALWGVLPKKIADGLANCKNR